MIFRGRATLRRRSSDAVVPAGTMKASRISVPPSLPDEGVQKRYSAAAKLSPEGRREGRGGKRKRGPRIVGGMMMVLAFAAAAAAAAAVGAAPASPLSSLGTCGAVTSELEQGPANCVVEKNSQWVRLLPPPSNSSSQNAPSPKPNGSATKPRPRRRLQSALGLQSDPPTDRRTTRPAWSASLSESTPCWTAAGSVRATRR